MQYDGYKRGFSEWFIYSGHGFVNFCVILFSWRNCLLSFHVYLCIIDLKFETNCFISTRVAVSVSGLIMKEQKNSIAIGFILKFDIF
jgi:hypothetical protein